ncbi:TRAP transporter small permease [Shewanella yunxiaonensis]|uniref:TRAP transporter small permease protein n=1 Tax=Shewanella yunxiaonensis TaxID=2829809 RepID=A0ABX7YUA8_9GAMM|nr:TRAP transporter small permease subunit [Shewanella yunxiaonensis]QUN06247.1 TRAP transporter small permease [Shewanella yunxiaonensis]
MLNSASKLLYPLTRTMQAISGVTLVSMMVVTLMDVVTRKLFEWTAGSVDFTFIGGIELIKYGLLITVFFCLPHTVASSQVTVDLFTAKLSERRKQLIQGLFLLGYVVLGAAMSYQFAISAQEAKETLETTQDLHISVGYFYNIISFASAVLSLSALINGLQMIVGHELETH